jgi:hypothetical protein
MRMHASFEVSFINSTVSVGFFGKQDRVLDVPRTLQSVLDALEGQRVLKKPPWLWMQQLGLLPGSKLGG